MEAHRKTHAGVAATPPIGTCTSLLGRDLLAGSNPCVGARHRVLGHRRFRGWSTLDFATEAGTKATPNIPSAGRKHKLVCPCTCRITRETLTSMAANREGARASVLRPSSAATQLHSRRRHHSRHDVMSFRLATVLRPVEAHVASQADEVLRSNLLNLLLRYIRPGPFELCFRSALSACAHGSPVTVWVDGAGRGGDGRIWSPPFLGFHQSLAEHRPPRESLRWS